MGYPSGARGDEIPIEGRICAIADVFDALTSDRVYRQAFQPDEARSLMQEGRGTQFDAELLDLFFSSFDDVLAIRRAAGTGTVEQTLAVALAHASGHRTPGRLDELSALLTVARWAVTLPRVSASTPR